MGLWRIPRWIRLEDDARERERAQRAARGFLRPALRLIVCGDSADHAFVDAALDQVARSRRMGRLLLVDEAGSTRLAAEWADRHRVECIEFATEWGSFGVDARSLRNAALFRAWPSGVVILGNCDCEIVDLARLNEIPAWTPRLAI
jgi:hypothetical protein